jgi:hypothetical protein
MADQEEPGEEVPRGAAVLPEIPEELGVGPLFLAVLHAVVFLEGSDDEVIDPDAAVEALEYMATYLQRLGKDEIDRLREDVATLVAYAREQKWPKEQVRFFKEFLSSFGVGEGDEA